MTIENLNECCSGNENKSSFKIEQNKLCPVCKKQGTIVKNLTVRHMVIDELIDQLGDKDFLLCMCEECDITYFNLESNINFNKQQVKVPIWFKKDANPIYVCYCSKVTEEQVITAVLEDRATSMREVLKITGAMSNAKCQTNNPLGKCCHEIINAAIDKAQLMK